MTKKTLFNDPTRLSSKQAAEDIGVHPMTLSLWRRQGKGPAFYRISRILLYYTQEDLDRWREQQKVDTSQQQGPRQNVPTWYHPAVGPSVLASESPRGYNNNKGALQTAQAELRTKMERNKRGL